MSTPRCVFVTGGTGYVGRRLLPALAARGHAVRALARPGSERKVPPGCELVSGDALDASSFATAVPPADTFVHLVGVPHPSPAKAQQFRAIDLTSVRAARTAARAAGIAHFVYVSAAQPAPVMKAYIAVRAEGERTIRAAGLNATFLRPWYVLGPGHRWPYVLLPVYWMLERWPPTAAGARRLGLVSLDQMVAALVRAVEQPADGVRIVEVPEIRASLALARAP
jgi:uncharacterized protein YbjT (DUF2867 family)